MNAKTLTIAGTRSGCGKTTVTLALMAACVRRGLRVQGCKTGPDVIDPGHQHALTARNSRSNRHIRISANSGIFLDSAGTLGA